MAATLAVTLMPFAQLPPCAISCGALFDANGACVPPQVPEPQAQTDCFCRHPKLAPWTRQANGVCDYACSATPADISRIQTWYQGFCGVDGAQVVTQTVDGSGGSAGSSSGSRNNGSGGDWLSNHWRWVIFIVVVVVGIAGIWTGACIWRRRYLKKKERNFGLAHPRGAAAASGSLGPHTSWGPGASGSAANIPHGHGVAPARTRPSNTTTPVSGAGVFMPAGTHGVHEEKVRGTRDQVKEKEKKKWVVNERT